MYCPTFAVPRSINDISPDSSSEMSLQNFPLELLELVFKNLDVFTLARARLVCCQWKESVDSMETRACAWQKRCLSEIDSDALRDILPYDLTDDPKDPQTWKNVYCRLVKLGRLGRTNCRRTETDKDVWPDSPARCMVRNGDASSLGLEFLARHIFEFPSIPREVHRHWPRRWRHSLVGYCIGSER